jgi:hypothetical protein
MTTDSEQAAKLAKKFRLGPLGTLNQVITALGKTIRAMAHDEVDSQKGARICNGLGILRACLETRTLQKIEERMDEIADRAVANATERQRDQREGLSLQ